MIKLAKGAERLIEDFMLTRYACYLIVVNGNPRKEVIALGQHYKSLAEAAQMAGIVKPVDYAIFQNRTMPEDLLTPGKSIKQIEREESKRMENKSK